MKYQYRLLHEFYIQQTATNLSGLCATYLVSGTTIGSEKPVFNNAGRDDIKDRNLRSSPFMSSPVQHVSSLEERPYSKTVTLVRKHDLEGEMCRQILLQFSPISFLCQVYYLERWLKHHFLAIKANYQQISSVHIYSVGPSIIQVRTLIRG